MEFTRQELISLVARAEALAAKVPSKTWKAAYMQLAQAADYLDAMTARVTLHPDIEKELLKSKAQKKRRWYNFFNKNK